LVREQREQREDLRRQGAEAGLHSRSLSIFLTHSFTHSFAVSRSLAFFLPFARSPSRLVGCSG
jgi:hypothetical protein